MKYLRYKFIAAATLTLSGVVLLCAFNASAAFNEEINYQGKLLGTTGGAVADGTYHMKFRLFTQESGGSAIFEENRSVSAGDRVSVISGLFSVMLGSSTPLSNVNFDQTLWLEVQVGGTASSSWETLSPRKRLGAVPAAFEAGNSQTVGGVASTSLLRSDQSDNFTSGTLTFDAGTSLVVNGTGTFANATATTLYSTILGINSEYFTDLTGSGLSNVNGALTVSSSSLNLTLDGLSDVNTTGVAQGNLIYYNNGTWEDIATSSLNIDLANTTGTLGGTRGGTGLSTVTQNQLLIGGAGNTWTQIATSSLNIDLANTAGILPVVRGGTGLSTFGGTNTILYTSTADNLTSNANFVFANGNLGVGTSSPFAKLSVAGQVVGQYFTATATDATSTLPRLAISTGLSLFGTYGESLSAFCVGITGGAGLCDGVDSEGSGFSTTSADFWAQNDLTLNEIFDVSAAETTGNLLYWDGDSWHNIATSSLNINSDDIIEGATNLFYSDSLVDAYLTGGTGITYSSGNISFDCSEVEGTGINCSGENITLDATGDWTGTLDSLEAAQFLRSDAADSASGLLTFSAGFISNASSTIGNGTQQGGLTISGGATTTGTLIVQGTGTSTFANGINLSAGCFAISGACVVSSTTGDWTGTFDGQEGSYYLANSFSTSSALFHLNTIDKGYFFSTTSALFHLTSLDKSFFFSTSSADYWAQNDLTLNEISDVSAAETTGNLLYWDGDSWHNIATSSLNIDLANTTGTLGGTRGGTGLSTVTQNQLLIGGAGNTWTQIATTSLGITSSQWTDVTGGINYAGGNVGVGSSTPWAKLAVGYVDATESGPRFAVGSSTATNLIVDAAGRLQVGTSTALEFVGGDPAALGLLNVYTSDANPEAQAIIGYTNKTSGSGLYYGVNATAVGANSGVNTALYGWASDASDNRGIWIDSGNAIFDERVGIGTTSPYAKLSVAGRIVGEYFTATSTATSTFPTLSVTGNLYDGAGTGGASGTILRSTGTGVAWTATSSLGLQATDDDLVALAALSTTGLVSRTGAGTYATRTLTQPAAGITVGNGDGVSGNPTLALANDLAALEGLGSTGIAVRTASDTWAQRTLTGTSNEVTVSNGDGVSGNPTISLPDTVYGGSAFQVGRDSTDYVDFSTNSETSIIANGVNNLTVSATGVGIGDPASITALLHVNSTDELNALFDAGGDAFVFIDKGAAFNKAELAFRTAGSVNWYTGLTDSNVADYAGNEYFIGATSGGATPAFLVDSTNNIGLGTTTPWARLSIVGQTTNNTDPLLALASSSGTTLLRVANNGALTLSSGATTTADNGVNITDGCFAIDGTCLSTGGNGTVNSGTQGQVAYYAANGTAVSGTSSLFIDTAGRVGVGTTTPSRSFVVAGTEEQGILNVANSTSAGANALFQNSTTGYTTADGLYVGIDGSEIPYIWNYENSDLVIATNNAEVMRFDSTGTVGIGTTSPSAKLSVHARATDSNRVLFAVASSTASATTTHFVVDNAGSAAVGTADTSEAKLTVQGASTGNGLRVRGGETDNVDYMFHFSDQDGSLTGLYMDAAARMAQGTTTENFRHNQYTLYNSSGAVVKNILELVSFASSSVFVVGENGNVGIGTSTPGTLLSIQGVANFRSATTSFSSTGGLNLADGCYAIDGVCIGGSGSGTVNSGTQGQVAYYAANGTAVSGTSSLFIDTAGRVGIGTTTPNRALDVQAASASTNVMNIRNTSSTGFSSIDFYDSNHTSRMTFGYGNSGVSSPWTSVAYINTTNSTDLSFLTGSTERMRMTTGGYFGIGTSTPWGKLSVSYTDGTNTGPRFVVASSSHTDLVVESTGNVNIDHGKFYHDVSAGETSITNLNLGPVNFEDNAGWVSWIDMDVNSGVATGTVQAYSAQIDGLQALTVYAETLNDDGQLTDLRVVVGTSTAAVLGSSNIPYGSFIVADGAICVDDGGASNCDDAAISQGEIAAEFTSIQNIDLAENYPVNVLSGTSSTSSIASIVPGEIVMLDTQVGQLCTNIDTENGPAVCVEHGMGSIPFVSRADKADAFFGTQKPLLGIVSTDPGIILGGFGSDQYFEYEKVPVALKGRVPVRVSGEGGAIQTGDRITLSTTPGVGMKASAYTDTVGVALESFTASTSEAIGEIIVYVDLERRMPQSHFAISENGNVGIGTTTPGYKLQVDGAIAAQSFVNLSSAGVKTDIGDVAAPERASLLDVARSITLSEYRYANEATSSPLRLGLIAEQAPKEILSFTGDVSSSTILGIDLYKLSVLTLAGVQELAEKVDTLEGRVANLEKSIKAGTRATTTANVGGFASSTPQTNEGFFAFLKDIGAEFIDGVLSIAKLAVSSLTIGSSEEPSGITLFDEETGEPYCVVMKGGELVSREGACDDDSDRLPPVVHINGGEYLEVPKGGVYVDLGVSVQDNSTSTVELSFTVNGEMVEEVTVDTDMERENVIVYSAVDEAGNTGYATRTVEVVARESAGRSAQTEETAKDPSQTEQKPEKIPQTIPQENTASSTAASSTPAQTQPQEAAEETAKEVTEEAEEVLEQEAAEETEVPAETPKVESTEIKPAPEAPKTENTPQPQETATST